MQTIIQYTTQQIMSLCTCRGAVHDVEVFKCNLQEIPFGAFILADKRDQGIIIFYLNSQLSFKVKRRCKLDSALKSHNQKIDKRIIKSLRNVIEIEEKDSV